MAPETIILLTMLLGLTLYTLLAGADFGAGVWEFNTRLRAPRQQRAMIYRAIGPVWEANHVWLIFVIVGMFGAFPAAFAAISRALWIPLLAALVGIVFRGASYAFRTVAAPTEGQQRLWEAIFALASTAAPFFLGAALGAVASGRLAVAADGTFHGSYLTGWLVPLAVFNGFFVVGLCAFLAAVYLAREAAALGDGQLASVWRARSLASGAAVGALAIVGLVLLAVEAPALWEGLVRRGWALVVLSMGGGVFTLGQLVRRRYGAATVGSIIAVGGIVWAWGAGQYPYLVPPAITIASARSPENVLWVMVGSIACGAVVLVPSLAWLLYLFKFCDQRGR